MSTQKIKVNEEEVEVLNSSEDKNPKITRIKADDDLGSTEDPFAEAFSNNPNLKNNPMINILGNIEEIKKIKPYFFFSIVCGLIGLFVLREYMGAAAIALGCIDLWKGSKLTKTASYFGIFLGLICLVLFFQ